MDDGAQPRPGVPGSEAVRVTEKVEAAVRPLLEREGYDLILVEYLGSAQILRLYIDLLHVEGSSAVGIEDCTRVSRWVSDVLDATGITDEIPGAFNLEVSSPGLDRPLVRPRDFCRFAGSLVRLTTRGDVPGAKAGRRRFKGRLEGADDTPDGGLRIEVDGQPYSIRYELIDQARLVPEL